MNPEDIKKILAACPPDMTSSDDPEIAAALAAAEEDDALRAFREEEAAFDRAFSDKLKAATPPADLKERILAAAANQAFKDKAQASTPTPTANTASTGGGAEVIHFPWWQNPAVWSIAACFVVLFGISVLLPKQQDGEVVRAAQQLADEGNDLDGLVALAVQRTMNVGSLDFRSRDYTKVESFLTQKGKPLPMLVEGLQQEFAAMKSIGCATMQFQDGSVSMVCFENDGKVFHLFVADRTKMSKCSDCPKPELRQVADRKAATWTDARRAYVLTVGNGAEDPLPLL